MDQKIGQWTTECTKNAYYTEKRGTDHITNRDKKMIKLAHGQTRLNGTNLQNNWSGGEQDIWIDKERAHNHKASGLEERHDVTRVVRWGMIWLNTVAQLIGKTFSGEKSQKDDYICLALGR